MSIKYIRFDICGQYYAKVVGQPCDVINNLGMKIVGWEGCPIADCIFAAVLNAPDELPEYMEFTDRKCSLYDGYSDYKEPTKEDKKLANEAWGLFKQGKR